MKQRIARLALIAATFAWVAAPNAWATPIDYNTLGVVGTIDTAAMGDGANEAVELIAAQILLNMALGAAAPAGCESLVPYAGGGSCYKTNETYDYSGTLIDFGVKQATGANVPMIYEYAIAKYDGLNAGYILFYLPDFGYNLPTEPGNFWTTREGQWELSHVTPFNAATTRVPDNGLTASLLGMGLMGLGYLRRRLN